MTRKNFSKKVKEEELRRAKYRCRKCKVKIGSKYRGYHFNHKKHNWDNSQKECQVLCLDCHWKLTKMQLKNRNMKGAGKKAWRTRKKVKNK